MFSKLFCESQSVNKVECILCKQKERSVPVEIVEDPLLINVQESLYYSSNQVDNFFQSKNQTRYCRVCRQKQDHEGIVSMDKLPRILALRMGDSPMGYVSEEDYKLHKELFINNKSKKIF